MLQLTYATNWNFLGGSERLMNEIIIEHNGVQYTKDDIIQMLDLVLEIVGEEVWSSLIDLNLTITLKSTLLLMVMMKILYKLVLIVKMKSLAVGVDIANTLTMPAPKMNTKI